ncbi:MAG: trigger factor, partial [Actinobacteria bacterium]|nr:trigger factor [Actinomycetota bacterium]
MKSAVETLSPTRVRISIDVDFKELEPHVKTAYQTISEKVVIPGFRKGKVPNKIIDQRVGRPAVLQEAVNEAVPKAYADALKDKKVYPIGRPSVKVDELKENEELKFSAEVDVRPDFETPKYKGLKLQVDKARDLGEDVLKQLDDLRARFSTLTAVDRAAQDKDVVILDIIGTKDGEQVNQYSGQALAYTVGSDGLVPGADEVLIGAKSEQKLKLDFTPEDGPFKDMQISLEI